MVQERLWVRRLWVDGAAGPGGAWVGAALTGDRRPEQGTGAVTDRSRTSTGIIKPVDAIVKPVYLREDHHEGVM
ncbi:hypothetical protein [Pseudactinotalea suaedae]|uniref:hypothetical protein n=1 Tax=Pseudactinotalea suaedae TaxID=1524924 RepID=UPI0012E19BD2|nr:hypothetical protein [Pseudactinotalea suaedae]